MTPVFGQSLQLYYERLAAVHFAKRRKILDGVQTKKAALAYVAAVQRKTAKAFRLPQERPAVQQTEIIRTIPFLWGKVEKIVYQVPGNGPVSANLYLPHPNGKRFPVALVLCGHAENGKAYPAYQQMAMLLAYTGFAAMVIDPIGQGDRHQFGADFKEPCWNEHCYVGRRLFLLGDWTGARMALDAMCAIDHLASRPELDLSTLCVTGNSGGGTATTFLCAVEKRITACAPCCYVTSWEYNIANERPTDNEQIPPHSLAQNLDVVDFLIARAPMPTLICGKSNDFFDPRGTKQAFAELKKINSLLGRAGDAELFFDEGNHGLSFAMRKKVCEFFARHAGLPKPEILHDPEPLPEAELSCGKLAETLSPHIREAFKKRPVAQCDLAKMLKLELPVLVPSYRVLRENRMGSVIFSRFGLTENDLVMSVLYKKDAAVWYHLPEKEEQVTLYVADEDAKAELLTFPDGTWGIDLRGVGETAPTSCYQGEQAQFLAVSGADYHYAALGLQLDQPLLGGKVRDLLKTVSLLATFSGKIRLVARGKGCVAAKLAQQLDTKIAAVEMIAPPPSWEKCVLSEIPPLPQSSLLFGAIGGIDWK